MKKIIRISVILAVTIAFVSRSAIAKDDNLTVISATASSSYSTYYSPDKAIDDNVSTYWIGASNARPWWIKFDTGEIQEINKITMFWYSTSYTPTSYDIQVSSDGVNWENVYTATKGTGDTNGETREINRQARFIRLYIATVPSSYPILKEFSSWLTINVPHLIRFQGALGNSTGMPLDGTFTLTFKLYDVQTGGIPIWEEIQQNITIENGALDVELGSVTPINLSFAKQYWLGVTINTDGEMIPRFKLTSSPYAFTSER